VIDLIISEIWNKK